MLLAGRFKCPSPANPGNKTPFGASVFMHQLLCAWAFVRVLKCSSGRQARNGVLILRLGASGLFWDWSSGQANRHRSENFPSHPFRNWPLGQVKVLVEGPVCQPPKGAGAKLRRAGVLAMAGPALHARACMILI